MTSVGGRIGARYLHSRCSIVDPIAEGQSFALFGSLIFAESSQRIPVAENEPNDPSALAWV
jgi:hypothetical protein